MYCHMYKLQLVFQASEHIGSPVQHILKQLKTTVYWLSLVHIPNVQRSNHGWETVHPDKLLAL
jgi:hypothetical protein